MVKKFILKRIFFDDGNVVNLLTFEVYIALGLHPNKRHLVYTPLIGLGGKQVPIEGAINLTVELGDEEHVKKFKAKFMVIDIPFSYNAIIGRPILYDIGACTSFRYLTIKIPMEMGVAVVRRNYKAAREAYLCTLKDAWQSLTMETLDVPK